MHDDALPFDPELSPASPAPRRAERDVLAVIAMGGMVGASARYGIARWLPARPDGFPWATFWTNALGSLLLGLLLVVLIERFASARLLRPFVATGVIGAFTTMSTYQVETALLLRDGHPLLAVGYGLGSVTVGLGLAYAGVRAGRLVLVGRGVRAA